MRRKLFYLVVLIFFLVPNFAWGMPAYDWRPSVATHHNSWDVIFVPLVMVLILGGTFFLTHKMEELFG